jgi:hypothetical protein
MPASKTAGTKRKAAGGDANAAKAKSSSSSSTTAVYMVQCTRSSHAEHIDIPVEREEREFRSIFDEKADLYGRCYDDEDPYGEDAEHDAVAAQLAAAKHDGTWMYGTPAPGSRGEMLDESDIDGEPGVMVFSTLKSATAYAAKAWDELQETPPPGYAEVEGSDSAVRKTKNAQGYLKYQRDQMFHYSESMVVCSTLTVQVVAARLM